jgi:NADP-dependent 3-hydroxy acid dehydrogenase YdfG
MTTKELDGRVAVVTGASRGLGRAMAIELGAAGAKLALVGRDRAKLDETAAQVGPDAVVFVADVTDEAQVRSLEQGVRERFGHVDILVNNAGMNIRKPLVEYTLDEWNTVLDTNLTSVFLVCRSFIPMMRGRGYGRIINLASMMSHVSLPGRTAYSASKAAMLGVTRALAQTVRHRDQYRADRESRAQPAISVEHPFGAVGEGRRDRETGPLPVFRRCGIYYRVRCGDRRGLDVEVVHIGLKNFEGGFSKNALSLRNGLACLSALLCWIADDPRSARRHPPRNPVDQHGRFLCK